MKQFTTDGMNLVVAQLYVKQDSDSDDSNALNPCLPKDIGQAKGPPHTANRPSTTRRAAESLPLLAS